MVCLRKVLLLTSLLSYNWLSIKPVYSLQQCMAKQFALSTRSFDKFQEKEAFSGILPKGISQNIIQRVFLKLQETLKWISIIYIFSGAPKLFFSLISSLLIVWPMERKQGSFWVYYPLFRLILFTFYISENIKPVRSPGKASHYANQSINLFTSIRGMGLPRSSEPEAHV